MLPLLALPLLMGAASVAKQQLVDKPQEKRNNALAASTAEFSPWTGMHAGPIQNSSPINAAIQGGMSGFMLDQNMQNAEAGRNAMAGTANQPRPDWSSWLGMKKTNPLMQQNGQGSGQPSFLAGLGSTGNSQFMKNMGG